MSLAHDLDDADLQAAVERSVRRYLHSLGFSEVGIAAVMPACLARARKRVGRGAHDELHRCAIETAQQHIDNALERVLGIAADDLRSIAQARAALLLGVSDFPRDALLTGATIDAAALRRLRQALPVAIPPETPRPMVHQTFSFFLRR